MLLATLHYLPHPPSTVPEISSYRPARTQPTASATYFSRIMPRPLLIKGTVGRSWSRRAHKGSAITGTLAAELVSST